MPPTPSKRAASPDAAAVPRKRATKRVAPPSSAVEPDDDDDEPAAPTLNGAAPKPRGKIRRGWSGAQQTMDSTSTFAQTYRPGETSEIIKFLEDEPYASYRWHWVDTVNNEGAKVRRPYTCGLSWEEDCPLCEAGHKASAVAAYNIAICGDDGGVQLKSWDTGPRIYNQLKGFANDPKIAPLSKGYFLCSKTGAKSTSAMNIIPVKATSLEEDYDTPVPDPDELARLVLYTEEIVEHTPRKQLRELAAELVDYD